MNGKYDDIIELPHHVSRSRKRMPLHDRAAQFSPFAALTGYDAAIQETGRLTESSVDLAFDGTEQLDEKIRILAEHLGDRPEVTIRYFTPDERKTGGAYVNAAGTVKKLDLYEKTILMEDGAVIPFDSVYDITGDLFSWLL